jgi:hypothetical protein
MKFLEQSEKNYGMKFLLKTCEILTMPAIPRVAALKNECFQTCRALISIVHLFLTNFDHGQLGNI